MDAKKPANAKVSGHREFKNKKTGERIRFDRKKPDEVGHKATDHYHRFNPKLDRTNSLKIDQVITEEAIMDIKKYTSYFHDGSFLLSKKNGEKLEIWMTSSEIDPDWGLDPSILSSSNYIVGKLTLFGVKNISIDGVSVQRIRDGWDDGEILDFEINDEVANQVTVQLHIEWDDYSPKLRDSLFDPILIQAERYEWENLPDYPVPENEYYKYLDKDGNPVKKGTLASRLYPPEGVEWKF